MFVFFGGKILEICFSDFMFRFSFSPFALPPILGTFLFRGFAFRDVSAFGGPFSFFRGGGRAGVTSEKFSLNIFSQKGEEDAAQVDDVTQQVRRQLASVKLGSELVLGFPGRGSFFSDFLPSLVGLLLPFAISFTAFSCVFFCWKRTPFFWKLLLG